MEETNEFRHAVRVVLKRQMRNLLDQLEEAGEECAVLTVNVENQTCYQIGSPAGEVFLSEQQHLTNNFLTYCEKYRKRPGTRSLLQPDFSFTSNTSRCSTRQAQSQKEAKSSPKKTAKRSSLVTDGPIEKLPRQESLSSTMSTRSGRKISARYFESLQLLSTRNTSKSQMEADAGSKDSDETTPSGQYSENGSEMPVHDAGIEDDDYSNSEMAREDDIGDNSVDADPDFKPAVRVLSNAVPAQFKSIEIKKNRKYKKKTAKQKTSTECQHCGIFITGRNLNSHIRRVHLKEKKHKCQVCDVAFYTTTGLEEHKLSVHTRQCAQCSQYVVEVEHWKEGIYNSTRRRVQCTCGSEVIIYSTRGRSAGKQKVLDDSENDEDLKKKTARFACGTCGKLFLTKYQCVRHSRCHSLERPHMCDLCGAPFRYGSSLKKHLQKQHGVMRMMCDICGKNYSNESSLKVHMSKTHIRYAEHERSLAMLDEPSSEAEEVSDSVTRMSENIHKILGDAKNVQVLVNQQEILPHGM